MQATLSNEMFWLVLTALMTALFWVPYVLNRMAEIGIWGALRNPDPDAAPKARWADRLVHAHGNAVENLVVFVPLVLAVEVTGAHSSLTASACAIFFFARLAHVFIYTLGVPVLRTLAFVTGFAVQVILALVLLGVI